MITLQVEIEKEITQTELEYIFDCWTTFVTQDLGWESSDAILIEVGEELSAMRRALTPDLPPS